MINSPTARIRTDPPLYGIGYVPQDELDTVSAMGVGLVLTDFPYEGDADDWLGYLDEAAAQNIQVVAWLWPPGWSWDGTEWQIDAQARTFIETVADHPALLAIYSLHEPYWNDCPGCGYTTAEQQMLYDAIKEIRDVPVWSAVDSMAFWTERGDETAFADGICDYCETWYYPFRLDGSYERDELIERLTADLEVAGERGPNSKIIWTMQAFAQGHPYDLRMPTAEEMEDMADIVYGTHVDGALWYMWVFNDLYNDYLVNHPELFPTIEAIYQRHIARNPYKVYLPVVTGDDAPMFTP